ncbi:MAG: two-component regulator propeller domain-containing protein [Fluviicola sp.]
MKIAVLFFLILGLTFSVKAQQFSFISYSNDVGLPQSQVQSIAQDDQGYLWVGTLAGLAKFNGNEFIPFPNEKGLFKNRVSKVFSYKNSVYVGHEGGFSIIRNNKAFAKQLHKKHSTFAVTDFVFFNDKLIVAVEGGGIYSYVNNKLISHPLPNDNAQTVRSLCIFKNELIIGTRDGLYASKDLKKIRKITTFESVSISKCAVYNDKIHITTFNNGYFQSNKLSSFTTINLHIEAPYLMDLIVDREKNTWLASDNGLIRYSQNKIEQITNESGIPSSTINCIFQDNENNIWLGSEGKGLIKIGNKQILNYTQKNGFSSDLVVSICQKNNSSHLIGTYDLGLFEMSKNGSTKAIDVGATIIWQIEDFGKSFWLGTDQGLIQLDAKNKHTLHPISGKNSSTRVVRKINSNQLFVASENKMALINASGKIEEITFIKNIEEKLGIIRDVECYNEKIYLATTKGLFSIHLKNRKFKLEKAFNSYVASLSLDKFGRLWIGTEDGIYLFNGINYTELVSNIGNGARFINFIEPIEEFVYIGTNDGLYIYLTEEKDKPILVNHIGISNGLLNLESNINSSYFDNKFLWFGTAEGLVRIDINGFQIVSPVRPKLSITELQINYEAISEEESESLLRKNTTALNLPYSKNTISILLDALYLEETKSIRYHYLLEGLNSTWTPLSSSNSIQLTNLPPGEYKLKIQAVTLGGIYSDTVDLPIIIRSPFWQTWWFILSCLILLFLSIRYYFRMSLRRVKEKAEKEKLINESRLITLEQQSLNASMNRHFIFNALNSIQYFIMTQDKLSATRYLSSFAKLIRKNLDSATETNNMVFLNEELERLELYLSLESIRFKDKFNYEIRTNDIEIEHVKVPAMLLQPFVENAIIHGILPNEEKIGEILVEIRIVGEQLEIIVDDNGIGIDESKTKKSGIEGDHISRGMEITSHRIELIRTILKKDYELIGPFQMENNDRSIKGTRVLIKIPYENLDF